MPHFDIGASGYLFANQSFIDYISTELLGPAGRLSVLVPFPWIVEMSQQTNSLLVLSYNVSFEASAHVATKVGPHEHKHEPTAHRLGVLSEPVDPAKPKELTLSGRNQATLVDSIPSLVGHSGNFDFVGLQESSRSKYLQQAAVNTLNKMTRFHTSLNHSEMASFYDHNRYTLRCPEISGELESGRPFHILIFKENVVFVNIHNPHRTQLNADEEPTSIPARPSVSELLHKKANLDDSAKSAIATSRIIMTGDFNDAVAKPWKPFEGDKIQTEVKIKTPTPWTCCHPNIWPKLEGWTASELLSEHKRGGDYIFDSESEAECIIPSNHPTDSVQPSPDWSSVKDQSLVPELKKKVLSDHLPIYAILPGQ